MIMQLLYKIYTAELHAFSNVVSSITIASV